MFVKLQVIDCFNTILDLQSLLFMAIGLEENLENSFFTIKNWEHKKRL